MLLCGLGPAFQIYFSGWKELFVPFDSKTTIIITLEIKRKYYNISKG